MNDAVLSRAFRKIGRERGRDNEDRFFRLFKYGRIPSGFPHWFHGIRPTTQEEDCRGIDAVAFTDDVGKVFLQIKSSKSGVEKFKKQQKKYRKREWIFPIIIKITDSDADILEKTRHILSQARITILNHRNASD